ncbi:MAG TPA: PKD domain-containing protein, partial [Ginsengibacter sp.]|nr:PKD domain-containing protein [Ginsengibacter sp.]
MRKLSLLTAILLSVCNLTAQKISPAGTTNICQNHTQEFTVTGGSPTSFQWQKDGVNINGATSASYTTGTAGVYRVIINGGKKQGDTLTAVTLVVNPNPKANFTFNPDGQCSSVPVFFTNSSQDGASYLWNFDDPNSGSNNTSTQKDPSHFFRGTPGNGTQTFNVKLITKSAAGCVDSITKPITIKQRPDASLGGTGSGKFNGDNYFSICGNLPTGDFNFSNQSTTPSTNTSYRIVWGDGAPDYTSTVFNTVLQHTYSTGTHQMLFIVTGQNGCIDTGFYRIYVGTNPAVGMSNPGNTAICGGSSLTFPITGIENNPPGTIYTITFNDGSMPEIFEHPNIPASITHKFDKTSCGTISSSGSTVYPNSFSASIRASNPCNSSEATIVPIYVSEKPNAKFVISPKDTICVDNIVTLTDSSKSSSVYNGTCTEGKVIWSISPATGWSITNGGILGNDYGSSNTEVWQSGSKTLKLQFSQPGVYTVKLKTGNAYCGLAETVQTICVNPKPSVAFAVDNNEGCAPFTVTTSTTANTPTCGENKYIWSVKYTAATECGNYTGKYIYLNNTDSLSKNPVFQFLDPGTYNVSLVMLSPGGTCSTPVLTKTIVVKDKPRVEFNNLPDTICQYQSISPTATVKCFIDNSTTYLWSFPGATPASSTTADPGKVTIDNAGETEISLTVTNSCGATTITKKIMVNPTPGIEDIANITVCAGETAGPINITTNPSNATITWTNSNTGIGLAASGSSATIPAFTSVNNTTNTITANITVNATLGTCSSTKNFSINVGARPETPTVQNVEYCLNASATPLTATAAPGNHLLWYNTATGGTGSTTAPTPSTTSAGISTYYVSQVSGSTNCESSRVPISVKVNPIPSIASATANNPVNCATATGSIILSGLDPSKNYQVSFTKSGIPTVVIIQTNSSGNLIIPNLSAGLYTNIFVSLAGCPSNAVGPFTLSDPNPPDAPVVTSNSPICFGTTLNLGATTSATGPVTFKWTGPDGFTSNLQNPAITNATLAASGNYFVTVTQNNCTSATSSINVIVNALPAAPSTAPVSYCIDAVASPLTAIGNSLLWYTSPTGGTGSSTAPTPDTHISGTTDYFVTQTDINGCESPRATLKVTIHPNAIAKFTPQKNLFCPPFTITAAEIGLQEYPANNSEYRWYIDGSYIGSGLVFPGFTLAAPNDSVTIKLVTNSLFGCKQDSMSYKFFTYKLPNPNFTLDKNDDCGPLSVLITNTTEDIGLYNYYWDFGNGQTSTQVQPGTITFNTNPTNSDTTYFVKLKMLSECDTITLTKSVHVSSKPKALFSPDITTGCSPMKVTFKNTSRGLNNTYYWDFGDGHTATTTSAANVEHTFYTGKVDTFNVRLIAGNGCGNDTLQYAVIVAPNTIKANLAMNGPDHSGCLPHTVALINNSAGASSFQWDFGDGNFLSTSKNVDTVYHTYYNSGSFTISMRAQNNCSDTTVFDQVTVYPKPVAAFTTSVSRLCKGDVVSFSNQSSLATSYQWHFGDGTTSVLENPTHTYTTPGIYKIKLLVFKLNAPGSSCIDSTEKTIEVVESLPGTFTMSDSVATCAPLTVRFSNPIRPSVTAHWDFGDGTQASGDDATHTYLFTGTYTITLNVTVSGGCTYKTTKTITVKGPSGKLRYTGGNICSPGPVRFEADAVNTNTYHWDFGDGVTQTTTQPVVYHSYENPGNYIPTLILRNTAGCDYPIRGIDTIKVDRVDADFKIASDLKCGSTTLSLTDNSFAYSG